MMATITHINASPGGVPKLPQPSARITRAGLDGDSQRDLVHHGGPDRALCLYSLELIEALQREGHTIFPGAAGENITVRGLDWAALHSGQRLRLGAEVLIELTDTANPCRHLTDFFVQGAVKRIAAWVHPGWSRFYARVLQEGTLQVADPVTLLPG
ncbi:MAG: MOSC domain-containing protein [Anaerolineae bacterium]|jgi:MOSC domain-containing protein YiiM|uniref:MOSC domain-containing protein n=1 Tax=Candidatus Amarolinea dominans TaxID=3140696 RepID=UPI001D26489E|nr:MOSC domain-containing protein [Anaerolineae bacterium]MBK7200762.1 MOSC domain-containing protein [Anaerolineae bacterium]MBK9093751.1 MOSC domain-containing protein [Anaerolineae bacterium]MBK9234277.1 MOSC domain-containing protein [Anaerolineae bacterium]